MKDKKSVKNVISLSLLCAAAALCACGLAACSDKTGGVTVEQLVEANDRQKVVEEYGNLHITENITYDSGDGYTANALFYANGYGLVMDYLSEQIDGDKYYSTTVTDGMMYLSDKKADGDSYEAYVIAEGEYNAFVGMFYNIKPSEVTKAPEVRDGIITVETECGQQAELTDDISLSYRKTFRFNAETLLIESETTSYSIIYDSESYVSTNQITYEYGCTDYNPAMTAYKAHVNAEEKTGIIVVRNVGAADESRTEYVISSESKLSVRDSEVADYALFADADCTVEVEDYRDYIKDGYVPVFYLAEKILPTLKDLLAANDCINLVNKYGNIHFFDVYEYDGVEYTTEMHYSKNAYGLVFDSETYTADEIYSSETVMNGVKYGHFGQDKATGAPVNLYFNIVATDGYDEDINEAYFDWVFGKDISGEITLSDGKIVLAEYVAERDCTGYYTFNAETLLMESYKEGDYVSIMTYGVDYVSPRNAYNCHLNADDGKETVIIQNPKTEDERRISCTVSASSWIFVYSQYRDICALYENPSCTNGIEDVNAYIQDNEYPTLYLGEKKSGAISFEYTYSDADCAEFNALLAAFEETAKDASESPFSVQIAYDYAEDKYLYVNAQSIIALAIYDLDNTDSNWNDYISAYNADRDCLSALNETRKRLHEAGCRYDSVTFKNLTEKQIAQLLRADTATDREIAELSVKNQEIQREIGGMDVYASTFMDEGGALYEKLVANNQRIAQLNDYENYYEYAREELYFRDWDGEDIAEFCKYVKEYIVPLSNRMTRRYGDLTDKLTADQLKQADIIVSDLRISELETDYVSMYFNSFGGALSERFNALTDKNTTLFAESANGSVKAYTDYIGYYGEPFCFFGASGYSQSVNTYVHEAGHYASAYAYLWNSIPLDLAETFSQGNEFLFLAFMQGYLDEEVYEYCVIYRLASGLYGIIQNAFINEFEYRVYGSETALTAADYKTLIAELGVEYGMSDSAAVTAPFILNVAATYPCYYVSYALSGVSALDLFATATRDYKSAQECYRILQGDAAKTDGFRSALALSGIGSPFDESTYLNIKSAFDFDAIDYSEAVQDAILAEESEIRELVTLTKDDERVNWNGDGKVLLLTFHKYPDSYKEGETVTTAWTMWTVTDGEMTEWYAQNQYPYYVFADKLKQVLGMPLSSTNTHISAVWVDVSDVIRPAYQPDPTKQLTAEDLDGSSLGEYKEWFNSNIISSYCSVWGQYPWTRLGYTYNWAADDAYGLSEFLVLSGAEIEVEFTKTLDEFVTWLYYQSAAEDVQAA
ncbi:MAG: hypothetical protein ACI4MH_00775 [Candidatus Coproplasma sp.]